MQRGHRVQRQPQQPEPAARRGAGDPARPGGARYGQWLNADGFGKLREPLLALTHFWRGMDARHRCGTDSPANPVRRLANQPTAMPATPPPGHRRHQYGSGVAQAPLDAFSVFNFFKPSYLPPGERDDHAQPARLRSSGCRPTASSLNTVNGVGGRAPCLRCGRCLRSGRRHRQVRSITPGPSPWPAAAAAAQTIRRAPGGRLQQAFPRRADVALHAPDPAELPQSDQFPPGPTAWRTGASGASRQRCTWILNSPEFMVRSRSRPPCAPIAASSSATPSAPPRRRCQVYSALGSLQLVPGCDPASNYVFPDYKALVAYSSTAATTVSTRSLPISVRHAPATSWCGPGLFLPAAGLRAERAGQRLRQPRSDGSSYGLHASMPELANLFNAGKAAIVANVGTLVQPVTKGRLPERQPAAAAAAVLALRPGRLLAVLTADEYAGHRLGRAHRRSRGQRQPANIPS